ncbi:MAG: purine-nucleoside phosphorylase [Myxococcales bacterium]|nr:purine-nucleoside phosphorylase [Myxococcales bacterium]
MSDHTSPSSQLARAKDALLRSGFAVPRVALVLGSGLGAFADTITGRKTVPYGEIPGMPGAAVAGHAGNLVCGEAAGLTVAAMQGRVHLYEGHAPQDVVFGVRLMIALGAEVVVLTNAAGGIGEGLAAGDLMLIEDQLNLTGTSCLLGENDPDLGVRFPSMEGAYDGALRTLARAAADDAGIPLRTGVYAGVLGPAYETAAEVRMLATMGADAVGMSTVLEAIAARHMGARVLGLSCITNLAAGRAGAVQDHADVQRVARESQHGFETLLARVLERIVREEG